MITSEDMVGNHFDALIRADQCIEPSTSQPMAPQSAHVSVG